MFTMRKIHLAAIQESRQWIKINLLNLVTVLKRDHNSVT